MSDMQRGEKTTEVIWFGIDEKSLIKKWISFLYSHYNSEKSFVPPLRFDEADYFSKKNPSFSICQVRFGLAFKKDEVVGRILNIINPLEEKKLQKKRGRIGYFEFIEEEEVAFKLLDQSKEWFFSQGCVEITGPHSFTDLDIEGLLLDNFDLVPTIAGAYAKSYYQTYYEKYGFKKDVDYHEYKVTLPTVDPLIFQKMRQKGLEDQEVTLFCPKNRKEVMSRVPQFWDLLEKSFYSLYGVTPLTKIQRDYYTKKYLGFIDPDFMLFVYDKNNNMIGFFAAIPNLSLALQKANSKLLPWGLFHILKAFKYPTTVDFLLAGVDPSCAFKSIAFSKLVLGMYDACKRRNVKYIETNHELETNYAVNGIWKRFEHGPMRRSRIYSYTIRN